jgi:hypothetical protein
MRRRRHHVLVSYSHQDAEWLKRLTLILEPLTRSGDLRLSAGRWNEEFWPRSNQPAWRYFA